MRENWYERKLIQKSLVSSGTDMMRYSVCDQGVSLIWGKFIWKQENYSFSFLQQKNTNSVSPNLTISYLYWEIPHKVLWCLLKCMAYGIMNYSPIGGNSTDVTSFFCISSVPANLQIPKWGNLSYATNSNKPPIWKIYSRDLFWAVLNFPGSWTEQLNRQHSAQEHCFVPTPEAILTLYHDYLTFVVLTVPL